MYFVYRYYDKACKVYAPLSFVETEPKTFFRRLHNTAITEPKRLIEADLHRDYVDCIGVYNQDSGIIEPLPEMFGESHFDIQEDLDQLAEIRKQVENGTSA